MTLFFNLVIHIFDQNICSSLILPDQFDIVMQIFHAPSNIT